MKSFNRKILIKRFFVLAILQLCFISLFSQSKLDEAYSSFRTCNYSNAMSNYLDILNDNSSSQNDKAAACSKLAYLSWHIRQNIEEARRYIIESLSYNDDNISLYLELANYEKEAYNFKEALKLCELSRKADSESKIDQYKIDLAEATIVLAEATCTIEMGEKIDKEPLLLALDKVVSINRLSPGSLDVCEVQLGLSLLLRKGNLAFQAWEGYFRISSDQNATGMLYNTERNLSDILLAWDGNKLQEGKMNSLIVELANSRFYHYSYLLAKADNFNLDRGPDVKDIIQYYEFCRNVDSLSDSYHRSIALNGLSKDKREDFYDSLANYKMDLWNYLSWDGRKNSFRESRFEEELYKRFGTVFKKVKPYYTSMGKTGLFFFAHTVSDEHVQVEQYAYSADVHYVSLDFMYANSYDGWFLDSPTGRLGGWSSSSMIVRMRRAYSEKPITMWNRITNPELKSKWLEEIETLTIKDKENSIISPVSYFPGTVNRMQFNACSALLKSLQTGDEGEPENRLTFISKFESLLVQASIYCHEGRHIIDNRYRLIFEPTCRDYEFRAKCSEIIFSENPYFTLAFSPVYRKDLNSKSKHSRGSRKAMENLSNWMDLNKNQINNSRTDQAALTQLDLLTDDQIISVFQSMDPLFRKRTKGLKK